MAWKILRTKFKHKNLHISHQFLYLFTFIFFLPTCDLELHYIDMFKWFFFLLFFSLYFSIFIQNLHVLFVVKIYYYSNRGTKGKFKWKSIYWMIMHDYLIFFYVFNSMDYESFLKTLKFNGKIRKSSMESRGTTVHFLV